MKVVKLDEILFSELETLRKKHPKENYYTEKQIRESPEFVYFINAMRIACKQTLVLAAENAKIINDPNSYCGNTGSEYPAEQIVSKQSILDLINQIK